MQSTILMAAEYGPPDVLEFVAVDLPSLDRAKVRVQVKAAGINPIDARRMTGEFRHGGLPQTFGTEFAGVIVEVPPGSTDWKVGDEVLGSGDGFTHASVIDVPIGNLVARPPAMAWPVAGTLAGVAQTATTVLDELGELKTLLIHGASGGVGSIAIQLARERGITVVATASEKNLGYLRELGAIAVPYGDGLIARLEQVHPAPFDASIDMAGTEEATQAALARVKADGPLVTIAGRKVSSPRIKPAWVKRNRANLEHVVQAVAEGRMRWTVSATFPFAKAADAYTAVLDGHTRGKSALVF
ncbi:NADPH2:quinone reductase [Variovorax sp. TBS-050B]|uniref:NADP-dependent oxidoreductase n=1 Tax=Variovorax sp. TBS-050B TaxID=2940551 RepID=UPI002477070A|nr:NADP-dependent oxidoreductase [Variovorax sp. TBS-050B]MDH6593816.1 NADPH2:quinone reductase [Variovorax sp. TBS-050B]